MNLPAASCGVSRTARNAASFGEYDPERFKDQFLRLHRQVGILELSRRVTLDLSAPFHLGIEHSAAQSQCYAYLRKFSGC